MHNNRRVKTGPVLAGVILLLVANLSLANDLSRFRTIQQEEDYQQLVKEIRCLTCPNQNIAESEGGLAKVLKEDITQRLLMGEAPESIRESLKRGYGEQILYRPSLNARNALLWMGPFALCCIGFVFWWTSLRSHG
jgi:cytochrome c-type biogenesis protein CcmH